MNEQLEFVRIIAQRLEKAGIPYMLTGSLAMAVYATPRMTRDIDVVVELQPEDVKRVAALFATDCYVDEDAVREAVAHRGMFNIIHDAWVIKADLIVRKQARYRVEEFSRRRRIEVDEFSVWVVAPEDLILSKLAWSPGSEMQFRDVVAIVRDVAALDWDYMERWAEELGVRARLEQARCA